MHSITAVLADRDVKGEFEGLIGVTDDSHKMVLQQRLPVLHLAIIVFFPFHLFSQQIKSLPYRFVNFFRGKRDNQPWFGLFLFEPSFCPFSVTSRFAAITHIGGCTKLPLRLAFRC
ncbi:hypothetical protein RvY_16887-1 [Ramazzottius varieornatus]|uniref:Uncharacterized protein n=1 Tax=Ramazzottius varieornatus TaxID=947166 RepID=A0A1D1W045_RAMVA|nr:hypothetical protein RvY_16887-1 [Ramazzottius varieornatus]